MTHLFPSSFLSIYPYTGFETHHLYIIILHPISLNSYNILFIHIFLFLCRYHSFLERYRIRMKGKVKMFNQEKGYGFITKEDGKDVFFHYSQLMMEGFKNIRQLSQRKRKRIIIKKKDSVFTPSYVFVSE